MPDRLLRASDLDRFGGEPENAEWKPVMLELIVFGAMLSRGPRLVRGESSSVRRPSRV